MAKKKPNIIAVELLSVKDKVSLVDAIACVRASTEWPIRGI